MGNFSGLISLLFNTFLLGSLESLDGKACLFEGGKAFWDVIWIRGSSDLSQIRFQFPNPTLLFLLLYCCLFYLESLLSHQSYTTTEPGCGQNGADINNAEHILK